LLTKSQARLFFLLGTLLFALLFIGLTIDTLGRIPKQTNDSKLTEEAKRGKEIWDKNNCMGCHTILGEGGYYAPELTKVVERRGEEWIKVFIKDPQAMYPGERKMVKYNFTDGQISDVIAFLKWVGEMDLNGFPPKPQKHLASTQIDNNKTVQQDQPTKFKQLCTACHSIGGNGGNVGPALDGVHKKYDHAYLLKWISDPATVKPGTAMPKLPLTSEEVNEIVNYLIKQ
jgi:nitric oxide reductase subunit C